MSVTSEERTRDTDTSIKRGETARTLLSVTMIATVLVMMLWSCGLRAQQIPALEPGGILFPLQTPPSMVSQASVSAIGGTGARTVYYWIVAQYPVGPSAPAGPFTFTQAASTFGAIGGITYGAQVNGERLSGTDSYDILRTYDPSAPTGACNCAVATDLAVPSFTDTVEATLSYTVATLDANTLQIALQNIVTGYGTSCLAVGGNCLLPVTQVIDVAHGGTDATTVGSADVSLLIPQNCVGSGDTATAMACSTAGTFTPALDSTIFFCPDVVSGSSPTLAVNGDTAYPIHDANGTALAAGELVNQGCVLATKVGSGASRAWFLSGVTVAGGGGGSVTTSGTTTAGYLPKFSSSTAITNSQADDGWTATNWFTYSGIGGIQSNNGGSLRLTYGNSPGLTGGQFTPVTNGAYFGPIGADSASAFRVVSTNGTPTILDVDTLNNRVGINTATPAQPLDVVGAVQSSTGFIAGAFHGVGGSLQLNVSSVPYSSTLQAGAVTGSTTNTLPATSGQLALVNADTTGNAGTASALAGTPTLCTGGQVATGILANGNATGCLTPSGGGSTQATLYSGYVNPSTYVPAVMVQTNTTAQYPAPVNASVISLPNPITAGNIVIVALSGVNPCTVCTVADNLGNTYALEYSQYASYPNFVNVWVAPVTHAGTPTITVSGTGFTFPNMVATEFQNVVVTVDVSASMSNASGLTNFSLTTTTSGDLIYYALSENNFMCSNVQSAPSGFNALNAPINIVQSPSNTNGSIFAAYTQQSTAGLLSVSGPGNYCGGFIQGAVLALKPDTSKSLGMDGDFYVDLSTPETLYGPKAGGVWPSTGTVLGGSGTINGGDEYNIPIYTTNFTGTTLGPSSNLKSDGNGDLTILTENAATATQNWASRILYLQGNYWDGSGSGGDWWSLQGVMGTGTNPTNTLTINAGGGFGGNPGVHSVSIPFSVAIGAGATTPAHSLDVVGDASVTGAMLNGNGIVVPTTVLGYQGPAAGYITGSISGSVALVSGTATVSTTAACTVSTSCNYSLTNCGVNASTGIGTLSVGAITAGTSFDINSLSPVAAVLVTDASTVCWQIN
ncbi:MAG TPA: hypothetical protein VGE85_11455 [Terracidiphilus sp.]